MTRKYKQKKKNTNNNRNPERGETSGVREEGNENVAEVVDIFARWELEVDYLHREYMLMADTDPAKKYNKQFINHHIDMLALVNNPICNKPQFETVCRDIGRSFEPKPIPGLMLVSVYKKELQRNFYKKKSFRYENVEALLNAHAGDGGDVMPFTWADRENVVERSSSSQPATSGEQQNDMNLKDETRGEEHDNVEDESNNEQCSGVEKKKGKGKMVEEVNDGNKAEKAVSSTNEQSSDVVEPPSSSLPPASPPSSPPAPASFEYNEFPYEKIDIFKVRFTGESEAQLLLSNRAEHQNIPWLNVSVERAEGEYLHSYISNLIMLEHKAQFVTLKHVTTDSKNRTCLLVDRFNLSLKDVIVDAKDKFWIEIKLARHNQYENWRMMKGYDTLSRPSSYFRNIISGIVNALAVLYESDISFDLSLSKVVFLEEDKECSSPLLREIFNTTFPCEAGVDDCLKLRKLFTCLKYVIIEIIKNHQSYGVFGYARGFFKVIDMLTKPRLPMLFDHPFMWSSSKKMVYYLDWQNATRFENLSKSKVGWHKNLKRNFRGKNIFPDWTEEVKKHRFFYKKMSYANQRYTCYYGPDVFYLLKFIRDVYMHLNDEMVNLYDKDGNLIGDDFQEDPNPTWSDEDLETILEFWCPNLAALLIEFTPSTHFSN